MEYNLADLFESLADAVPDRIALVCDPRRLTYAELDERANRLAQHLRRAGIGAGDHIGVHLYNCTEYVECLLAAFKIRAVPVNVNYRYVAAELRRLLHDADVVALVHRASSARGSPRWRATCPACATSSPSTTAAMRRCVRARWRTRRR